MKITFWSYLEFLFPYILFIIFMWIGVYLIYRLLKRDRKYSMSFFERILFKNKYGIDIYEEEENRRKKISGFKKNAENFLKELEKISSLFLEKENNFKLTPVQAILFVELFSGKILKSDKGKYYIISDLDLQHFIKQIQTKKITKEDVEKKLKEIEEYFIPKGQPEVNANELFFMLKTNQIPDFNQKEIFEFSHIDSAEKNIITNFLIKDEEFVKSHFVENENENEKDEAVTQAVEDGYLKVEANGKTIVYDLSNGIGGMYIEKKQKDKKEEKDKEKNPMVESIYSLENTITEFKMQLQEINKVNTDSIMKTLLEFIKENPGISKENLEKKIENKIQNEDSKEEKKAWNCVKDNLDKVHKGLSTLQLNIPIEIDDKKYIDNNNDKNKNIKNESKSLKENSDNKDNKKEIESKKDQQVKNKIEKSSFDSNKVKANTINDKKNENNIEDNEDDFLNDFDIANSIIDEFEEDKKTIGKTNQKDEVKKNANEAESNEIEKNTRENIKNNFFYGNLSRLSSDQRIFMNKKEEFKKEFVECLLNFKDTIYIFYDKENNLYLNKEVLFLIFSFIFYKETEQTIFYKNIDLFFEFIKEITESNQYNKIIFNILKNIENIFTKKNFKNNKAINVYLIDKDISQEMFILKNKTFDKIKLNTFKVILNKKTDKNFFLNDIILFVKKEKGSCVS